MYPVTETVWLPSGTVVEFQFTEYGGKALGELAATQLSSTNTLIKLTSELSEVAIVTVPWTVAPLAGEEIVT